jgi:hypothetical protein
MLWVSVRSSEKIAVLPAPAELVIVTSTNSPTTAVLVDRLGLPTTPSMVRMPKSLQRSPALVRMPVVMTSFAPPFSGTASRHTSRSTPETTLVAAMPTRLSRVPVGVVRGAVVDAGWE